MSESVGNRIKRLREAKGLTQFELREKAIPWTYLDRVRDMENDIDELTIHAYKSVAEHLGVSLCELLEGEQKYG